MSAVVIVTGILRVGFYSNASSPRRTIDQVVFDNVMGVPFLQVSSPIFETLECL